MTPSQQAPHHNRRKLPLLSPAALLLAALLLVIAYGVADLVMPREDVSLLTATAFEPDAAGGNRIAWAGVYAALYFAAVLLAPVLALAAVIFWALQRALRRRGAASHGRATGA